MAKIDCSVTVNYLRELKRMCDIYFCDNCPLSSENNGKDCHCGDFSKTNPETAIEIVQTWSDEHPAKTRLDDLLEKYPKFELFSETGRPMYKPRMFGYCTSCLTCPNNKAEHCWHEPVDGGATGKAVE